mmetsp:Transcript_38284/g.120076  ORF Transcript_38284/g.120076 Transcript_38284/m.120076 type:complete len:86 (-) Transcript_38284:35-292(-)
MIAGGLGATLAYGASIGFERWRLGWVEERRVKRAWDRFYEERDADFHATDLMNSWSPHAYDANPKAKRSVLLDKPEAEPDDGAKA